MKTVYVVVGRKEDLSADVYGNPLPDKWEDGMVYGVFTEMESAVKAVLHQYRTELSEMIARGYDFSKPWLPQSALFEMEVNVPGVMEEPEEYLSEIDAFLG